MHKQKKNKWYGSYGGAGILFLLPSYEDFLSFIGKRPSDKHSLDRINPYGNYELTNIRWADKRTQSYNQRLSKRNKSGIAGVELKGKYWYSCGKLNNKFIHLYCGKDFFEACCRRKSWESTFNV